jgi:hypothetical protein
MVILTVERGYTMLGRSFIEITLGSIQAPGYEIMLDLGSIVRLELLGTSVAIYLAGNEKPIAVSYKTADDAREHYDEILLQIRAFHASNEEVPPPYQVD